jgi:hypothetical protein
MEPTIYVKEDKQLKLILKKPCFGAYYLERWVVIHKLCKFKFISAKEHVFMIALTNGFCHDLQIFYFGALGQDFVLCKFETTTIVEIPEGFWENSATFPNFTDEASQSTLNSLNESNTITIDYIKKEVKLKKDSAKKNYIKTILTGSLHHLHSI